MIEDSENKEIKEYTFTAIYAIMVAVDIQGVEIRRDALACLFWGDMDNAVAGGGSPTLEFVAIRLI